MELITQEYDSGLVITFPEQVRVRHILLTWRPRGTQDDRAAVREQMEPILARAAKDNWGSVRVLEKCGFRVTAEDKGFAHGRGAEVEEFVLQLD